MGGLVPAFKRPSPGTVKLHEGPLITLVNMDAADLGPAADAEHDLPGRVLLVKLPPLRAAAAVGVAAVVALQLVRKHVACLPVRVAVRHVHAVRQHLRRELVLVVAQRALEEVGSSILRSLLNTLKKR